MGLLLGGFLQFSIQVPFLWRFGFRFFEKVKLLHPGVLEALKRMVPSIIGAAGFQINLFAVTVMASTLPLGSISYLYYAERLVEFPMALFAVSVATVLLPELSMKKGLRDPLDLSRVFTRAIKGVFFITIPAMAGLAALREPVVSLLFQQGLFDTISVKETAATLLYFCMGLWAFSGTRLLVTLFYSLGDAVTPFWAGAAGILFNLAAGFFLGNTMGHRGLALSVSLAGAINFFILMVRALVHMDPMLVRSVALLACRSIFASVMMYFPVAYMVPFLIALPSKADLLVRVAGVVILGSMIYAGIFMVISGSRLGLGYKMVDKGLLQRVLFSSALVVMVVILFMIVYSENGFKDWLFLSREVERIEVANRDLDVRNREIARTIERLKNDMGYIEHLARHELGMVSDNEIVFRFKDGEKE